MGLYTDLKSSLGLQVYGDFPFNLANRTGAGLSLNLQNKGSQVCPYKGPLLNPTNRLNVLRLFIPTTTLIA